MNKVHRNQGKEEEEGGAIGGTMWVARVDGQATIIMALPLHNEND